MNSVENLCLRTGQMILAVFLAAGATGAAEEPASMAELETARSVANEQLELMLHRTAELGAAPAVIELSAEPAALLADGTDEQIFRVDCDRRQSIGAAIARSTARRVVIEVSGLCAESVAVDRPGVTIRGAAEEMARIDPPDDGGAPIGPAIRARGAHELTLERLILTGGRNGLESIGSRKVHLDRVDAIANTGDPALFPTGYGVVLEGSEATLRDCSLSANIGPIASIGGSTAVVEDSTLHDNTAGGPVSLDHSTLQLIRTELRNNEFGPQAIDFSETRIVDSQTHDNRFELVLRNSRMSLENSTSAGTELTVVDHDSLLSYRFSSWSGDFLLVAMSSSLDVAGSRLDSPSTAVGLFVQEASFLNVHRSPRDGELIDSDIRGNATLSTFSEGRLTTAQPIDGSVDCSGRSRAVVNQLPTGGIVGCD